jgi:transposase
MAAVSCQSRLRFYCEGGRVGMDTSAQVSFRLFVGVDIAARSFVAVWGTSPDTLQRAQTFAQTPEGFVAFQQQLQATGIAPTATLVVMEATGSYWVALAVTLHEVGYVVCVVNPAHLYNYVRSLPRRGKTDALDAQVLARFAFERKPAAWTPPPAVYHELRQRLVARDGLMAMRNQARNQRHALEQWPVVVATVLDQLVGVIADLDRRIAMVEGEIAEVLANDAWASSAALLATIPGVGIITSAWLLVGTLNFSLCGSAEQAASFAGLTPLARESGTSVRGRAQLGRGGNRRLRTALYLATLAGAQYNPVLKAFYERLRATGKPMKVARCAVARKLLHVAWAVVTKGQPFDVGRGQLREELLPAAA